MNKEFNVIFESLNCGSIKAQPSVITGDGDVIVPDYEYFCDKNRKTAYVKGEYNGEFRDTMSFDFSGGHILCRRTFENISGEDLSIKELKFNLEGICFGKDINDDYFWIGYSDCFGKSV